MNFFRLRSYDVSPKGGYYFSQEGDKPRNFPNSPMIEPLAQQVATYRSANGLPRASYHEALEDVDSYQCRRLGNNPRYCIPCAENNTLVAVADNAPGLKPCAGCGAPIS